jgi:excisionase family DNA binding protein
MSKLLVKPGEASELMGVSRSTIYELMRSGDLDSVLIRSSRRIPVAAIERYIEGLLDNGNEGKDRG